MSFEITPRTLLENEPIGRPAWIELRKDRLFYNLDNLQTAVGGKTLIPILKANAFGHGIREVGGMIEEFGITHAGVVSLNEAQELRAAGFSGLILILDYVQPEAIDEAVKLNAAVTIQAVDDQSQNHLHVLRALDEAGKKQGTKAKVHIHIDTGMHREGIWPKEKALALIKSLPNYENIEFNGVFTHFATADDADASFVDEQMALFDWCLDQIENMGIPLPPLVHAANSAATVRLPQTHRLHNRITGARPGIVVYGLSAGEGFPYAYEPKPMMTIKAELASVKTIPAGDSVGYSRTWRAPEPSKIGLITLGYADLFPRSLSVSSSAEGEYIPGIGVLVGGRFCPIVGRVSMDKTTFLLPSDLEVQIGDEVVVIGNQGEQTLTLEMIAKAAGTNVNEIATGLHATRLPRIVVE